MMSNEDIATRLDEIRSALENEINHLQNRDMSIATQATRQLIRKFASDLNCLVDGIEEDMRIHFKNHPPRNV